MTPIKPSKRKPKRRKSRRRLIRDLMARVEEALDQDGLKATLSDFIRLTQLEKELHEGERPREIVFTWKDPEAGRLSGK